MANPEKIVSREVVFDAADRLKSSGVNPTNRGVLHAIGGGSMTTIAGHLRDWKAKQEIEVPEDLAPVDVPGAVVDTGQQAVTMIWTACQAEARREIEAVTDQANQRIKDTETDRDTVLTELAEAESEINSLTGQVQTATSSLREIQEKCDTLTAANEHLHADEQKARAVADEIERRAAELADALKHERERADQLHDEVAGLQPIAQRAATAEHENEALRADVQRLRDELAETRQQSNLASQNAVEQMTAARVALADNAHLQTQLEQAKKRSDETIATLTTNVKGLMGELEAVRKTNVELTFKNGKLEGQLGALERQVDESNTTLRALTQPATAPTATPAATPGTPARRKKAAPDA